MNDIGHVILRYIYVITGVAGVFQKRTFI